ncbi:hypothetical protein M758_1G310200 [Ceratodon purpureus]|uniref:Vacuolar protein sorting-associated protein TDA6 n=1 Tax=Ceratodon purpureus TaxID=3225 RepID=A0A8T0JBJ6_CERPU|nr:hypothetical protein KC19_1G317500 [Ceratodon purpureus]KAG0632175.1 hypothetical protein M758_1G310200 [Ceratodon purpureus]
MGAASRMSHCDRLTFLLLVSSALLGIISPSAALGIDDIAAGACPGSGPTDARLRCLTTAYAPLLKFDSRETFFPSGVDDFLPYMKLINEDGSDISNQPQPLTSSNLVYKSETPLTTYLTTIKPIKLLQEDQIDDRFMRGRKPTAQSPVPIYTSVVRKQAGVYYDFVYYAFYPYNQGKLVGVQRFGNHVGDWEHVTLRISFKNSMNPRLVQAYSSQHSGGDCLTPSNLTFVADTAHPILYVARGSHGTYNKPGRTVYAKLLPTETGIDGTELADDHDGGSTVKWETWNAVAVRVEGQPLAGDYTFWGYNGRWGNKEGQRMVLGFHVLESGPDYPASHTVQFQLDNTAFEDCVPSDS